MKKCGIVTITTGMNYGNRLQNYAIQRVLENFNYIPETIDYEPSYKMEKEKISKLEKIKTKILRCKIMGLEYIWNIIEKNIFKKEIFKEKENYRKKCFEDFIRNNIRFSNEKYNCKSNLKQLNKEYDVFITGSDQVWNPYWEGKDEIFYLTFADKKKRITYAPSFGVSEIPDEQKDFYKKNLTEIPNISVREEKGKEIIKELTGMEAKVVADPTFLLEKEKWDKIAKKPKNEKKYLFTYFLGILSAKRKRKIKKFAKMHNLEIISMYEFWNEKSSFGGPSEFLGLIKNAEYICTDSFHGAVFSIIYNKPFTIMDREDIKDQKEKKMNSRIETLLKNFHLQQCKEFLNKDQQGKFIIDYTDTNKELENKRKEALEYLKLVLCQEK